ncbi:putative transcriptional regulatory protein TcrX [Calidithermus terrae]|uniref:Putative transcriptional regulatory protein TcrX n=1 Tax=Calidithermus terrae TaxID=1408545 RepID=A0A399ELM7_9DEIN|nr:response regulator [Calidithermus terrae]RIH85527.1 putative transcriptional regulatory protein TcrX [Calidithermus terrae]
MARVLIIEDGLMIQGYLRRVLRVAGFQVESVLSGEEGLKAVREYRPEVVILDYWLPGANGLTVLSQLKLERPGLPVILLTANDDPEVRREALALGADRFEVKPIDPQRLLDVVQGVLGTASG